MSMCEWCRIAASCNKPEWHKRAVIKADMYCDSALIKKCPIISFGHTTPCFVSENKSVTRRNWTQRHLSQFNKGDICKAYSKGAQYGGECIGILKLTGTPFKQNTCDMTVDDYYDEGFEYLDSRQLNIDNTRPLVNSFTNWRRQDNILSVVSFKIIDVFPGMLEKYTTDDEIIKSVKALVRAIG